ncbi:T9SS type A sorting domain-containing protein [Flavobacterium sp. SUN052]|uniref:T9SS type A sorting domain-containing protein n=1 Tax=Flavobacterium sp. SUN052 TaxID=3002441 RepID=UPI00237EBCC8|nr:T9SS type A sorting domain-containing protein [Flavobacterium sp. SUN052]MEC4003913.1 T9SS type A sorting domain-containing protein [Flavobacterium sp. SUN052]
MKRKLLLTMALILGVSTVSLAQFSTGVVTLSGSTRTLKIDTNSTTVTMTLTGNSTHWLGIGFNGFSMAEVTDMFIWNSTTNRDYIAPGGHNTPAADAAGSQSWTITSDTVSGTTRTVVATRPLVSAGDYTFTNDATSINIIFSEGNTTTLAYHGSNPHAPQTLTRSQLGVEDFSLKASSIFPNPTSGNFSIKTKTYLTQVNVYTQTGAFVKTINVEDDSENVELNITGLQTGVYLIELKNDTDKSWKKVIVN